MNTTVVAVVSAAGAAPLAAVRASNVRVVRSADNGPAVDRAREVWDLARHTSSPYLLHDADPLAAVAAAWVARFDGTGVVGDLEIATAEVLARWRARSIDLPDYYLVQDPEDLGTTMRHWFFGVLAAAAPLRVVATRPATPLVDHLGDLRPGRWWPPLDVILADLDRVVPDQAGALLTDDAAPAPLFVPGTRADDR